LDRPISSREKQMTDDETTLPEIDERAPLETTDLSTQTTSSTRRRFLTGVAAATGMAFAPSVTATQDAWTIAQTAQAEVVASFEPPNLPENITTDAEGNVYVSMAPPHGIWQVPPDGEPSSVASIGPDDGEGILLGVTRTDDGTMYTALNSGVSESHGVWRVPADGSPELMASIPTEGTFPNGINNDLLDDGVVVSDSARGAVWKATDEGAEVWFDSPLLDPDPYAASAIGINGIDVGPGGDLYAANLNYGAIVRIPVQDGTPGDSPTVVVQSDDLIGADGIAVDDQRNVYVAVNSRNKVSRVTADGSVETVVSGGELAFPSDVHFGPDDDQSTLYVCNFAFPSFQAEDETANPSLMRIDIEQATTTEDETVTTTEDGGNTTTEDGQ
jgi:sugar lactone lactonase YvrE